MIAANPNRPMMRQMKRDRDAPMPNRKPNAQPNNAPVQTETTAEMLARQQADAAAKAAAKREVKALQSAQNYERSGRADIETARVNELGQIWREVSEVRDRMPYNEGPRTPKRGAAMPRSDRTGEQPEQDMTTGRAASQRQRALYRVDIARNALQDEHDEELDAIMRKEREARHQLERRRAKREFDGAKYPQPKAGFNYETEDN